MKKYNNRLEVEDKYKWDLTDFYKDEKDFFNNLNIIDKKIDELKQYEDCINDSKKLLEFIKLDIDISANLEDLYAYQYLLNDQELGNSKNILNLGKVENLFNKYSLNTSFFAPKLLSLDNYEYNNLFNLKELNNYKVLLDKIYRNKEHILDKEKEDIISELNNSMNHFEEMSSTLLNSEHDYGTVEYNGEVEKITPTNLRKLYKIEDRNKRKEVYEKYNSVLLKYGTTHASLLNSYVKSNIVNSRIHNFKDAFSNKLFTLNMKKEAYDKLEETVNNNLDKLQRYFKLFKEILKEDDLHQYDLAMDISKNKKEYSIEDAIKITSNAVIPLGDEYQKLYKKIFEKKYVDFCQYPKKCSGGYSLNTMKQNSRILMSYNYDLESISTLIHEGGHNVHHQLVSLNNPIYYRDIPTLMAEVASLTNECLLSDYLYKNGNNKKEKMAGLINIIEVIVSNLFGAVREGKMEIDFYDYVKNGNTITKEYMDNLTYNSLVKFYGDTVILDEYSKASWERRSHYYMNYYLYNYAFCISIATDNANKILNNENNQLEKYLKYLKTGSDIYPIDAFKILDVDLCKSDVYENAIKYFDSLLDKLEKLIKE